MPKYIAQRLLTGLLTVLIASVLIFAILRPVYAFAPERFVACLGACDFTDEDRRRLKESLGLVDPLHMQYVSWIWGFASGDWGESMFSSEGIREDCIEKLPVTLQLVAMAQAVAVLVGIPAGALMALKRRSWIDLMGGVVSRMWLGLPIFWTSTLLLVGGLYFLEWSPEVGYIPLLDDPTGNLIMFAWPALVLGVPASATVAVMVRSAMLEALRQDDVQTMTEAEESYSVAVFIDTLRYTLAPAVVASGLIFPAVVGGALLMELIFVLDGVGDMFTEAANQRDLPVMEYLALFFAVWVIAVNTLVDILCGWLDQEARSTRKPPREEWNHLANPVRLV